MRIHKALLVGLLGIIAASNAQAISDTADCEIGGIPGDGTLNFDLGNSIAGNTCKVSGLGAATVTGTINYGTGSAPGSGTSGANAFISITDLQVLNPRTTWLGGSSGDGFLIRFLMPVTAQRGVTRTFSVLDGFYDDADGDGIAESGIYTRMNGSISYGAAISNASIFLGSDVTDGTPFLTSKLSATASGFTGPSQLVAQLFFRVPPGAGFFLPGSAIVEAWDADTAIVPAPGAAFLAPAALSALIPFRRRRRIKDR